jgi:DNA-binding transcriptional regulator GbsR (MarR family)
VYDRTLIRTRTRALDDFDSKSSWRRGDICGRFTATFARDADQPKLLSLYEQRLNRSVEKNLKLLRQLQADEQAKLETKTALRKALEEARLLYGTRAIARAAAANATSDDPQANEQSQALRLISK